VERTDGLLRDERFSASEEPETRQRSVKLLGARLCQEQEERKRKIQIWSITSKAANAAVIEDAIDTKLPNLRSTMSGDARLTEVNVQGRLFQLVGEKAKDAFPSWAFAATVWCTMCSLACC